MGGTVGAIWIKRGHGGPMDPVRSATLNAGRGIVGNADQRGRRQITLIDRATWDRVVESVGDAVDPATRRANLLLEGISLADSRGRTLRIGECLLRINGEMRPCRQMDEVQPGLQQALSRPWHGGAFGEVIVGGEIAIGTIVEWTDATEST